MKMKLNVQLATMMNNWGSYPPNPMLKTETNQAKKVNQEEFSL
jgi:hypothetical protein